MAVNNVASVRSPSAQIPALPPGAHTTVVARSFRVTVQPLFDTEAVGVEQWGPAVRQACEDGMLRVEVPQMRVTNKGVEIELGQVALHRLTESGPNEHPRYVVVQADGPTTPKEEDKEDTGNSDVSTEASDDDDGDGERAAQVQTSSASAAEHSTPTTAHADADTHAKQLAGELPLAEWNVEDTRMLNLPQVAKPKQWTSFAHAHPVALVFVRFLFRRAAVDMTDLWTVDEFNKRQIEVCKRGLLQETERKRLMKHTFPPFIEFKPVLDIPDMAEERRRLAKTELAVDNERVARLRLLREVFRLVVHLLSDVLDNVVFKSDEAKLIALRTMHDVSRVLWGDYCTTWRERINALAEAYLGVKSVVPPQGTVNVFHNNRDNLKTARELKKAQPTATSAPKAQKKNKAQGARPAAPTASAPGATGSKKAKQNKGNKNTVPAGGAKPPAAN
ncbi:MAG: hypothetical protein VXW74_06850 [Candidatus Thermoplasmatota archaeon]|nr:hypothetical protein [Candidatus Thermoplasmatota archaeon]